MMMGTRLERNQQNKMIAGVAAGLADYLGLDISLVRVIFILLAIFGFSGLLLYIILWIAVPKKTYFPNYSNVGSFNTAEPGPATHTHETISVKEVKRENKSAKNIAGITLIIIGVWFMLIELDLIPEWFSFTRLWPVLIIALGLFILLKSEKKEKSFEIKNPILSENDAVNSDNKNN